MKHIRVFAAFFVINLLSITSCKESNSKKDLNGWSYGLKSHGGHFFFFPVFSNSSQYSTFLPRKAIQKLKAVILHFYLGKQFKS